MAILKRSTKNENPKQDKENNFSRQLHPMQLNTLKNDRTDVQAKIHKTINIHI